MSIILWPSQLPIPIVERGQSLLPLSLVTKMDSGRVRVRPAFTDPLELVSVQWNFTLDEYADFEEFFNDILNNGSEWFRTDWADFETRDLAFLAEGYQLSRSDNLVMVAATLEVGEITDAESSDSGGGGSGGDGGGSGGGSSVLPSSSIGGTDTDTGSGPGFSSETDEGGSASGMESFGGGDGSGDESSGPPPPPPLDPDPEPREGVAYWGPIREPDPPTYTEGLYVAIPTPGDDDLEGYCLANGGPDCLSTWIQAIWDDFLAQHIPYTDAKFVWINVNLSGANFNATTVFPARAGGYGVTIDLDWSPEVEYIPVL